MISFNKPHITGKETHYIYEAVNSLHISGNGTFTKKCQKFFEEKYGFQKVLLTSSCTDALEMAAILADVRPGDEVIVPAYTFVSSANAFALRGAKIVFADSMVSNPNMDISHLESLITSKTKVIVPVHYAGVACDMDRIMEIANENNILVVEDAAQAIDSYYNQKPLGSIGHLAAFSFHETKNIISGEGGMLVINDPKYKKRAEIIWEKGTNRAAFFRGEVDKYTWVDLGSSFLPSDITAAFLYAQLEELDSIQTRRKEIWEQYRSQLDRISAYGVQLPNLPDFATNNAHMFYLVCNNFEERTDLIQYLRDKNIYAIFHYLGLHKSEFYSKNHSDIGDLPQTQKYEDCLIRLPFYYDLHEDEIQKVTKEIFNFYEQR